MYSTLKSLGISSLFLILSVLPIHGLSARSGERGGGHHKHASNRHSSSRNSYYKSSYKGGHGHWDRKWNKNYGRGNYYGYGGPRSYARLGYYNGYPSYYTNYYYAYPYKYYFDTYPVYSIYYYS